MVLEKIMECPIPPSCTAPARDRSDSSWKLKLVRERENKRLRERERKRMRERQRNRQRERENERMRDR